ncbi:MAG: hypothetical protein AAB645_01640 [Patescibacteria group bacterium]
MFFKSIDALRYTGFVHALERMAMASAVHPANLGRYFEDDTVENERLRAFFQAEFKKKISVGEKELVSADDSSNTNSRSFFPLALVGLQKLKQSLPKVPEDFPDPEGEMVSLFQNIIKLADRYNDQGDVLGMLSTLLINCGAGENDVLSALSEFMDNLPNGGENPLSRETVERWLSVFVAMLPTLIELNLVDDEEAVRILRAADKGEIIDPRALTLDGRIAL